MPDLDAVIEAIDPLHDAGYVHDDAEGMMRRITASRRGEPRHGSRLLVAASCVVAACVALALVLSISGPKQTNRAASSNTWQLVADVTSQFSAQDVSFSGVSLVCPSATTCFAIGHVSNGLQLEVTSDGGATWTPSTPPGNVNPTSITCPGTSTCAALATTANGAAMVETADGGASWTSNAFPGTLSGINSTLSCTTSLACVAIADSASGSASSFVTTDGGQTWAPTTLPLQATSTSILEITGLACHDDACTLLGSLQPGPLAPATSGTRAPVGTTAKALDGPEWHAFSLSSSNGGSTWSVGAVPSGFVPGYDFSCSSGADCLALGDTTSAAPLVIATTDGGRTWTEVSVPEATSGSVFLNWDSCTASECWVSGGHLNNPEGAPSSAGFLDATTNLGTSWISASLPPSVEAVGNVSCTDAATCFALGAESSGSSEAELVLLSNAP
jgi:photosystem II stability/assembly factor-like uncharacterized protein